MTASRSRGDGRGQPGLLNAGVDASSEIGRCHALGPNCQIGNPIQHMTTRRPTTASAFRRQQGIR